MGLYPVLPLMPKTQKESGHGGGNAEPAKRRCGFPKPVVSPNYMRKAYRVVVLLADEPIEHAAQTHHEVDVSGCAD